METVNGTPTVHSYAISRIEKTSDGYGGYFYTIVFETDTGTHIVTYTDGSGAAVNSDSKTPGENTISTLTSSTMFAQKNTAYERAEAVANITVKGMKRPSPPPSPSGAPSITLLSPKLHGRKS